jgi:hypothetical protein
MDISTANINTDFGDLLQIPGMAALKALLKPAIEVGIQVNTSTALRATGLCYESAFLHLAPPYAKFQLATS